VFRTQDTAAPFLTANAAMWDVFEPELRRRLSEIDDTATVADRVRAALLESLPAGAVSMDAVARKLGASARTLQRRLKDEGSSFQEVLDGTRENLARHYLKTSRMSGAEISFLLGFEDPNSFFRAFHKWTGRTPEDVRAATSLPTART
jgi:AraC-like DNA-binding protein